MFHLGRFGIAVATTMVVLLAGLYAHAATAPTTVVEECTKTSVIPGEPPVCVEWTHEEGAVKEAAVLPWAGAVIFLGGMLIWASVPTARSDPDPAR